MKNISEIDSPIGVILAAGKGFRAYPTTKYLPKVLIKISDKTLLEHNIEILRDQLNVSDIIIVIGYLGHKITEFLSYKDLGIRLSFVVQPEQNGIGNADLSCSGKKTCVDQNLKTIAYSYDGDFALTHFQELIF